MSAGYRKAQDPVEVMAERLRSMEAAVRDLQRPRPTVIPVLLTDPPEEDQTNLWLFPDGRLRGRHQNTGGTAFVYREWVATAPGSSTSATAPAPPSTAPTSHFGVWNATYTQSYRQSGSARTDGGAVNLYYGYIDGFNGRNRSLIGFDHATIATALAGSTITGVALRLFNIHGWYNNGADIHFGIHNFSSEPGSWAGGGIPRSMISRHHFGRNQYREVGLPLEFAIAIRDGWGKGIALESPSNAREFYGFAAGIGSGPPIPQLVVAYAK